MLCCDKTTRSAITNNYKELVVSQLSYMFFNFPLPPPPQGVLDRFKQVQPKVLFSVNAVRYNGKVHEHWAKLREVVGSLSSLEHVVVIPFVAGGEKWEESLQTIGKRFFCSFLLVKVLAKAKNSLKYSSFIFFQFSIKK